MTLVPGLELLALRKASPPALPPAPVRLALESPRPVRVAVAEEQLEVVEAQSPLTIIAWASAVVAAGLVTVAALLLLGPIVGTLAVVATTVWIVRRYEQSDSAPEAEAP